MSNQNLLEIKGLKVSYQADGKKVCAVNGVDLVLEKGETLRTCRRDRSRKDNDREGNPSDSAAAAGSYGRRRDFCRW